jgi:hypothetical protein
MEGTHDDDELSFITLSAATRNVTRYLTKEHKKQENEERPADANNGGDAEKHPDDQRKYIMHRLRELRAWERKLSGKR